SHARAAPDDRGDHLRDRVVPIDLPKPTETARHARCSAPRTSSLPRRSTMRSSSRFVLALFAVVLGCSAEAPKAPGEEAATGDDALKSNPCKWAQYGNGDYCSKSLNPNATGQNLYTCVNKTTKSHVHCSAGCVQMPPHVDDVCADDAVARAEEWVQVGMP